MKTRCLTTSLSDLEADFHFHNARLYREREKYINSRLIPLLLSVTFVTFT
jgi:hypothetical protein